VQDARALSISDAFMGPRQLGRYTLLVKLATGGMADIFLAKQRGAQGFEKLVVVKRILPNYAADPEFVGMFLDEGRLAANLTHPNIVQTFDLGEDAGCYFIAMEYVAGESLVAMARAARLKGKLIDDRIAVRLISHAALALDHAHRQTDVMGTPLNIVHRDVSPQNLLVTYDGQLKVVDFGIAKAANRATQTGQGQVKGKITYMAPEQLRGDHEVTGQADIFALGVVLFELVTGTRLVEGGDQARAISLIGGKEEMPLPSERRTDVDPRLNEIIGRALKKDLTERYATGGELHADLESWLATKGQTTAAEVSAFVRELFAEKIAKRKEIIERALKGDFEVKGEVGVAEAKSGGSMPDGTAYVHEPFAALERKRRVKLAGGIGAAALLILGVVALAVGHSGPKPEPATKIDKPVAAVTPAPKPEVNPTPPAQPTAAAAIAAPKPAPAPTPAPVAIAPTPAPTPVAAPPPKPVHVRARPGKLSIDTTPWTEVYWRGKDLGQTPLIGVDLPPGAQRLVLKNPGEKIEQTVEVEIKSEQTTAKRLRLQ